MFFIILVIIALDTDSFWAISAWFLTFPVCIIFLYFSGFAFQSVFFFFRACTNFFQLFFGTPGCDDICILLLLLGNIVFEQWCNRRVNKIYNDFKYLYSLKCICSNIGMAFL